MLNTYELSGEMVTETVPADDATIIRLVSPHDAQWELLGVSTDGRRALVRFLGTDDDPIVGDIHTCSVDGDGIVYGARWEFPSARPIAAQYAAYYPIVGTEAQAFLSPTVYVSR